MECAIGSLFIVVFVALVGSFSLLLTAFWIWMLIDCAVNEPSEGSDKIVWVIIIVLTHWIGALIYFFARRPKRKAQFGK